MADVWEKDLAQKSSLTTSDFIRVVGSDNVSYKQLVSDVADKVLTLGKSASTTGTISDLDAITPFTTGYATFTASVSPTGAQGAYWYSLIGWGTGARAEITCIDISGTVYTKVKDYSGWKAWVKQPTRAEVDALNNKTLVTNTSSAKNINLPTSYRGIMTIVDTSPSAVGMYIIYTTGSGNAGYKAILEVSGATLTGGANVLTYTPPSGRTSTIFIQNITGTASI